MKPTHKTSAYQMAADVREALGFEDTTRDRSTVRNLLKRRIPTIAPKGHDEQGYSDLPVRVIDALRYVLDIDRSYWTNYRREGSHLAFYVKANHVEMSGQIGDKGEPVNARLDDMWERYCDKHHNVFYDALEQAAEYYYSDWTSWPGDDQGQWKMHFAGRQGGHLCVTSWRGYDISRMSDDAWREFVLGMANEPDNLAKFVNAVVCMDHEFTAKNASENVSYHINSRRADWERERTEELEANIAGAMTGAVRAELERLGHTDEAIDKLSTVMIANTAKAIACEAIRLEEEAEHEAV